MCSGTIIFMFLATKKPANKRVSLLTLKRDYLAGIAFKIAVNNCQY